MDNISMDDIVKGCMGAMKGKIKNLRDLNIVVLGKSGVGKSTLINAVFRANIAETGIGKPVTQCMKKYTKQDVPLGIYDTKGLELDKNTQEEIKKEVLRLISDRNKSGDINEAIHCIWYCINALSNRFEEAEITWIREFTEESDRYHVPVIVILTQAISKENANKMVEEIETANLKTIGVVPVLAQDYLVNEGLCIEAYGLDKLIDLMEEALPDELIDTLANTQKVNLKLKKKKAQAAVGGAVAAATAAAASPLPVSDAALLIPIEVTMLTSITVVFGFEFNKAMLTNLVSSIIGTTGATVIGKTVVGNLLKFIPGAGSIVGGLVSATAAATITTALGEAYIALMVAIYKGEIEKSDLGTQKGKEVLEQFFSEYIHSSKKG